MTDSAQEQAREQWFDNVDEVIDYLAAGGWVAKKSTIYRHRKEGKLLPKDSGKFRQKDVDRYAQTWLKRQSTGKKVKELEDQLQREILEEELATARERRRKIERENRIAEGKVVDRGEVENWMAARAGILEAGLKHWIQSRVADWIRMSGGDLKKAGELINAMTRDLDEHINNYAQAKEFELVIDGDGEEDDQDSA